MNLKELKEILHLLDEEDITEFELEEEGMKLRIRKGGAASANHGAAPAPLAPLAPAPLPGLNPLPAISNPSSNPATAAPPPTALAAAGDTEGDLVVVKSPIVGTFYRAQDPNSPPLANVGDHVRVGQVLCIIEAMKLMNEIEAEVAGAVAKVHQENGQPVQYGEPLFSIRPDR